MYLPILILLFIYFYFFYLFYSFSLDSLVDLWTSGPQFKNLSYTTTLPVKTNNNVKFGVPCQV